ncbi:MAG: hypothetical protein Aurels2KO_45180 [Aureliella sp.]
MKRRQLRRGFSLLEMVSTIAIVGVMMTAVGSVLTLSIRTYQKSLKTLATQQSVRNFERRFRGDCRNALQVELAERQLSMIDQDGRLVVYEFAGPGCSRWLKRNPQPDDTAKRNAMRWDSFDVVEVDVAQKDRLQLVSLKATLKDTNRKFEIWVRTSEK